MAGALIVPSKQKNEIPFKGKIGFLPQGGRQKQKLPHVFFSKAIDDPTCTSQLRCVFGAFIPIELASLTEDLKFGQPVSGTFRIWGGRPVVSKLSKSIR